MTDQPSDLDPHHYTHPRHRGFLSHWNSHPAVPTGDQLTLGERAADKMRNGMGSWAFVFGALAFLAAWMLYNRNVGFDKYPFILLNLVLSCLAAMQGAILLIAAKRSDQVASQLAEHDFDTDTKASARIEELHEKLANLATSNQHLLEENLRLLKVLAGEREGDSA